MSLDLTTSGSAHCLALPCLLLFSRSPRGRWIDTHLRRPCCYGGVAKAAPPALQRHLGAALTADIERTYLLERERGYAVKWRALPRSITPVNRILVARRRR